MKLKIHYIVRHAKQIFADGKLEYEIIEHKFQDEQPIMARKKAFKEYVNLQEILDERRELNKAEETNSKIDNFQEAFDKWRYDNPEKVDKLTGAYDAEVILVAENYDYLSELGNDPQELKIHFQPIGDDPLIISELMSDLDLEYGIYQKCNFDTQDEEIKVPFWDYEAYYTYAHERHIWKEEFFSSDEEWAKLHTILRTPFDWSPYSKENWWNDFDYSINLMDHRLEKREREKMINHEELIKAGETETVEFKPLLFGTISGKDKVRDMKLEIAEVICSFMNKKGGNIYIGISDDGVVCGTPMENKKNKDEYKRHFVQQVKKKYFTSYSYVIHHYISEKFIKIKGKDIFVIQVRECKKEPVYLYNKEKLYGSCFQFFVREGASTEPKYCPKQLIDYVEEKWWKNKYTKNEE